MILSRIALIAAGIAGVIALASTAAWWVAAAQRDAARAGLAVAVAAAESNARALADATAQHTRDIELVRADARRAIDAHAALIAQIEEIRNDPTHDAGAADVLGRAVDLLRAGAAGAGGADPAPGAAVTPAGVR